MIKISQLSVLIYICFFGFGKGYAQVDSTTLKLDKLNWKDIQFEKSRLLDLVISGSRTLEHRNDVTDKVYVITRREILENGYYTLVDALASLPGIKISQPGSGQDGETFYMRGLLGNTYAKILINDIPIKSFVTKSVGISSQLPIRHAERIEVIYGTKASIYGVDASAGIINIILPQGKDLTDGDFYVDVGYGSNNLKRTNFFTSHKFKVKKKVLNTSVYGGFTQFDDWDVIPKLDTSLYRLDNYIQTSQVNASGNKVDTILSYLPHYDRNNYKGDLENPELGSLPGQSRYVGLSANLGSFILGGLYSSRQDHTSIGRSPIFTTYYNSLNFLKENTLTLNLAFNKRWSKIGIKSSANYLNYEVDPKSNENKISTPFLEILDGGNGDLKTIFFRQYDLYVEGTKYSYASSSEWEFDQLVYYDFNKYINSTIGIKYKQISSNPISSIFVDSNSANERIDSVGKDKLYSAFIQNSLTFSKLRFDLGLHYIYYDIPGLQSDSTAINDNLSFQLSTLYDINKTSQLRLRYGTAFRIPSPYYSSQSFSGQSNNRSSINIVPEYTYSAEAVYSWNKSDKYTLDISGYWSKTKNLITYGRSIDPQSRIPGLVYSNNADNQIELWGAQTQLKAKNMGLPFNTSFDLMLNFVKGGETKAIAPLIGVDTTTSTLVYQNIKGYPTFMAQFNIYFDLFKDLKVSMYNTFNTRTLAVGDYLYKPSNEYVYSDAFYKLNLQLNYKLNSDFSLRFRVNNVFDKDYAGIDATDQVENLLYNPQPRRNYLVSLMYTLNN